MRRIVAVAILVILAVPVLAFAQQPVCEQATCGAGDPPHDPGSRGYQDFIELTYEGAYGRAATCGEIRIEFFRLRNAASNGAAALNEEARRFVATRFMTQASYDAQDLTTYVQTSEYDAIRPLNQNDRATILLFIADLYRAFLQREPDDGGQCFWANDACGNTTAEAARKHPIRAFEESTEFGNLVSGLYDDGPPPSCGPGGGL